MVIWSAEIKEMERLYESFKGQLPELEKEVGHLIHSDDPNVILLYSRRCLEVIITDLCECELKRERGTEPLKGIIDKLNKEKKIPAHIASSMFGLNELSTYGTHPKDFDPEQIKPVLNNLGIIIKWYLKHKEIIIASKEEKIEIRGERLVQGKTEKRIEEKRESVNLKKNNLLSGVIITVILVMAAAFGYLKFFKVDSFEKIRSSGKRISVAVMPFQNMTPDTALNIWQIGIQTNLITSLSNSEELRVRQIESINYLIGNRGISNFSALTPSLAGTISMNLDAKVFIYGSINLAGPILRLNVQVINSKTKDILKAFQIDGTMDDLMPVIDTLSWEIKNYLIISKLDWEESEMRWDDYYNQQFSSFLPTKSAEAYKYFIYGQNAFYKNDFPAAREWSRRALAIDTNFFDAIAAISLSYYNEQNNKEGKEWCLKYYRNRAKMDVDQELKANFLYAIFFETPKERIKYLNQMIDIDDENPVKYFNLGDSYLELFQYEKAIPAFEKSMEIYHKWGIKIPWIAYYTELGIAYQKTGQYIKEKKLYRKADKDFPDDPELMDQHAYLALSLEDTVTANQYIEKWISAKKEQSWSEAQIESYLAYIFDMANIPEKAEQYYRKALILEPENPARMTTLAYYLIDKDRNINEGMELNSKALILRPENINNLHVQGLGLYKQGKYKEALEIMQRSWDLRMQNSIYNHRAFLQLEAAKKAVANQKNN